MSELRSSAQKQVHNREYQPAPGDVYDHANLPDWDKHTSQLAQRRRRAAAAVVLVAAAVVYSNSDTVSVFLASTDAFGHQPNVVAVRPGPLPPPALRKEVANSAVLVRNTTSSCSGIYYKQYLITSGQCLDGKDNTATFIYNEREVSIGRIKRAYVSPSDVAIATTDDFSQHHSLTQPLTNKPVTIGERFVTAGYTNNGLQVSGDAIATARSTADTVRTVNDPADTKYDRNLLCAPTNRGAALVSPSHLAIINSSLTGPESVSLRARQDGLDLPVHDRAGCNSTLITADLLNGLIAHVNAP